MMKLVYLASPYRHDDEWGVYLHIHNANVMARRIWKLPNVACISPCTNTSFFCGSDITVDKWLEGDLEILKRCDALFLNKGWNSSSGCIGERDFAIRLNMPVFEDYDDLVNWVTPKEIAG